MPDWGEYRVGLAINEIDRVLSGYYSRTVSMAISAVAASKELLRRQRAGHRGARLHGDYCRGCIKGAARPDSETS